MRFRRLGRTELKVSEIGFGTIEIGRDWAKETNPGDYNHLSQKEAIDVVNTAIDSGINFFDTAPAYWYSEEFLGVALEKRRHSIILATKVGENCDENGSLYDYSYEATKRFVESSLKKLRTDYLDLVQIHSAPLEVLNSGETYEALNDARKEGKIRFIGMTGGVAEAIRAVELNVYDTVQITYNLLDRRAEIILLDLAKKNDVGIIIKGGLATGRLTPKYINLNEPLRSRIEELEDMAKLFNMENINEFALRFILRKEEISTVIAGSKKREHIVENVRLMEKEFDWTQLEGI